MRFAFQIELKNSKLGRIGVLDPHLAEVTLFGLHWASYMSEVELNLTYAIYVAAYMHTSSSSSYFMAHIKFMVLKTRTVKNQKKKNL